MTDINPDVPDRPIVVPATPAGDQAAALTRDILLVAGALPALIAVFGTHDVTKIVTYVSSAEFYPVLGLIVVVGTTGYRQWLTRKRHSNDAKMADSASDTVAVNAAPPK